MLMNAAELKEKLSDPKVVVFDCRFHLMQPNNGRERYVEGHIPSAYYLDLEQDLSGPKDLHGGRHPLPNPEEFAEKMNAAGVTPKSVVVVYDEPQEGMAPRAWWLLRYLGHEQCYILNGGFSAWKAAGGDIETEVPTPRTGTMTPHPRADWVVSVEDVERVVAGETEATLVDARAPERYRGDIEPIDPVAGHIPGAHNRPWMEGLNPDGTWKSPEEQTKRFSGLDGNSELILYCGSGVTACANLFALALSGQSKPVRLYAGSWSDWASYAHHAAAKGDDV